MKLLTKEIERKARAQFPKGSSFEQNVVAKFFNPVGCESWYLMNIDEDLDCCWGIAQAPEVEMGSFSLKELESIKLRFGLKIERDLYFTPRSAQSIWDDLMAGKHV